MTLQARIAQWYAKAGGHANGLRCAERALEEIHELIDALKAGKREHVREEAADVAICLMVLASVENFDLVDEMVIKNAINECREWSVREDGSLYHVKKPSDVEPATPNEAAKVGEAKK